MLKYLLRALLVVSWGVALTLSAIQVEARSAALLLSADATIRVRQWTSNQTAASVRADIAEWARQEGILIGQEVPSINDNRGRRTIYIAGAGAEEYIASHPRVDFGDAMYTTFAPMIELRDRSLVGPWLVLDDVSSSSALME